MAERREVPYIPSYAGLLRFREEKSKIELSPRTLCILVVSFCILILLLQIIIWR